MPITFTVNTPEIINFNDVVKVQDLINELFKSGCLTEIQSETVHGDINIDCDLGKFVEIK